LKTEHLNELFEVGLKYVYLNNKQFEDQKSYISKHILGIVYKHVVSQIEGKGRGLPSKIKQINFKNGMIHLAKWENGEMGNWQIGKMAKWETGETENL
jgi:hypothetical protein